jgi:hypothetical protein
MTSTAAAKRQASPQPAAMTTTQLEGRVNAGMKRLNTDLQAYVVRVVDLHEPPFKATRSVGLQSLPRSKTVNQVISCLRELRRRDPITDPAWISEKYRDVFIAALDTGQFDVARKTLTDLASFEGHMPDQRLNVVLEDSRSDIKDVSPEKLALIFKAQEAFKQAERNQEVEDIEVIDLGTTNND